MQRPAARVEWILMRNILVADRDPRFRTLYQYVLDQYCLYEAGSVSQALECLAENAIDLVVTEWEFPDGTAAALLDHLATKTVPVVLVSLIQDILPPLSPVVKERLDKPFHLLELRGAVGELLAH
jgi:DNA-binding NtrC family response regulator